MPTSLSNMYSAVDINDMTVADLQNLRLRTIDIKDWQVLTADEQSRCIAKLQELVTSSDAAAESSALDAHALADRLNQINASPPPSPSASYVTPPPSDPHDQLEEDWQGEKASYKTLVENNCRPCYPIERGFQIFHDPGDYKNILDFWQWGKPTATRRLVFGAQLSDWTSFRRYQRRRENCCTHRSGEPSKTVLECRRRHGFEGGSQLGQGMVEQCKLQDWVEYQNYKLRDNEGLEKKLNEASEQLSFHRTVLLDSGYSAFEDIEELELGEFRSMDLAFEAQEEEAKKGRDLAIRKLAMAQMRLDTARSEELGDSLKQQQWTECFTRRLQSQHTWQHELRASVKEIRSDLQLYDQWLKSKEDEWNEKHGETFRWSTEGVNLFRIEVETAEYWDKFGKREELRKRAYKAELTLFDAEEEAELIAEASNAADSEDFARVVERTALIRRLEKEVLFAEHRLEEEREGTQILDFKRRVLCDLNTIHFLRSQLDRQSVLLRWIEQQRQELICESTSSQDCLRRSTRLGSKRSTAPCTQRPKPPPKSFVTAPALDHRRSAKITKSYRGTTRKNGRRTGVLDTGVGRKRT